jgi:hypothetical protein
MFCLDQFKVENFILDFVPSKILGLKRRGGRKKAKTGKPNKTKPLKIFYLFRHRNRPNRNTPLFILADIFNNSIVRREKQKELYFYKYLPSVEGKEDDQPDQEEDQRIQKRAVERPRPRNKKFIVNLGKLINSFGDLLDYKYDRSYLNYAYVNSRRYWHIISDNSCFLSNEEGLIPHLVASRGNFGL